MAFFKATKTRLNKPTNIALGTLFGRGCCYCIVSFWGTNNNYWDVNRLYFNNNMSSWHIHIDGKAWCERYSFELLKLVTGLGLIGICKQPLRYSFPRQDRQSNAYVSRDALRKERNTGSVLLTLLDRFGTLVWAVVQKLRARLTFAMIQKYETRKL